MSFAIFAMAATYTVTTPDQLSAAVAKAKGGDVIVMAPGDYGIVQMNNAQFDKVVIIRSQDPKHPARFSRLRMHGPRNLVLENLEFTRLRGNEPAWKKTVDIDQGYNVTIKGGFVHGTLNGSSTDDPDGLYIRNTQNATITGVIFRGLRIALGVEDSSNVVIDGNDFSYLDLDAIDVPGVDGAKITNNHFHDFRPAPEAHPDAIQCWTRNKNKACKNIFISHNKFDGAPNYEMQGVFFGDEDKIGGYDNIEISDNIFICTYWHAIFLGAGSNTLIKNNVVTAGPRMKPWIGTTSPATLIGNSAPSYFFRGKAMPPPKGNKIGGLYKK